MSTGRHLFIRISLGFPSVACAVQLASAQQPTDTVVADSGRQGKLAPVSVFATRLAPATGARGPRIDVPRLQEARPGPAPVAELLTALPGVHLTNDQGTSAQPTLDIRGFSLSPVTGVPQGVSVFLDGVRINEASAQELNFDLLPLDAITGAELIRGPTALFGKNTLGGALLLSTRRGAQNSHVNVGIAAGTYGSRELFGSASAARGRFDGFISARGTTLDGYQAQGKAITRQLFMTGGYRDTHNDAALSFLVGHDKIFEPGSLPESWFPVARRENYTGGDFFRPTLLHIAARLNRTTGDATWRSTAYTRHLTSEQFNVNVDDPNTRAFLDAWATGGTSEYSIPLKLGTVPLALTFGGEYAHTHVRYRLTEEPNEAAPTLPEDCDPSGTCERARVPGDEGAIYVQGVFFPTPRLSLSLAGRFDVVRIPFRDLLDPTNDGTNTFRRISPNADLTYAITPDLQASFSVGSGFRTPAPLELACASETAPCPLPFSLGADPPLAPVTVWSYEGRLDWARASGPTLSLSLFRTNVRDEIVFVTSSTAAGYFQNIPRTRRLGMETVFGIPLGANFHLDGSYSWLNATYQSDATLASALDDNEISPGDRFSLSPRHRGTLSLRAAHAYRRWIVDGTLTARAVSSQFLRGDEANRAKPLHGYGVADLGIAVRDARATLQCFVSNLLDRRYALFGVYGENPKGDYGSGDTDNDRVERFLTPAYPRTITVQLTLHR